MPVLKYIIKNNITAAQWYRKAAKQENPLAQFKLGVIYDEGQGVSQDYVQAHKWFNLSAIHGIGVRNRDIAEKKMTPAQVAEAQKLAREWKPKLNKSP